MSVDTGRRLERAAGHDHRVPVVRRDPRDELPAPLAGEVLAGGRQHSDLRVELQPLARELFEHVVRHDDGGLVDEAESLQLARGDRDLAVFPAPTS